MKAKLQPSRNDLPARIRQAMVALLNQHLADFIDLGLQAKQAHWNVKGPNFISLHELFDRVADQLEEFTDEVAERAVELGGTAHGTLQAVSRTTRMPSYPLELITGRDHVDKIAEGLATFGAAARHAIETASSAGDADTADLFTEVSRGIDKLVWMVEAHNHVEA